jgi:hypothetical protein
MFLNKLQVPAGDADQTLLMPKLQFRFRLIFLNFGSEATTQLTRQVIDCSRPNISFQKVSIPVYNSTIYMAGKHTWNTMSINLRDDASNSITKQVGTQIQKQLNMQEQSSARAAGDYKFRLKLEMLDGGNSNNINDGVLETWDLEGCYLESVNYNTVNYANSEVVTIALTVQYDNAVQLTPGTETVLYGEGSRTPGTNNNGGMATSEGGGGGGGGAVANTFQA